MSQATDGQTNGGQELLNETTGRAPPTEWPTLPEPYSTEQFLDLVAYVAKIDRSLLVPSVSMETLSIPSLDMVDILFEMEEKFDVYVPMGDELTSITYLADLITVLSDLIRDGSAQQVAKH